MTGNAYLLDLRPLGVLMRALGWLACSREVTPAGLVTLKLRRVSWLSLYCVTLVSAQLGFAFWLLHQGMKLAKEQSSDMLIFSYFFVIGSFVPHLLPFFVLLQQRNQREFCTNWAIFQTEFEKVAPSGRRLTLGLGRRASVISVLTVVFMLVMPVARYFMLQRTLHFDDVLRVLGIVNEVLLFSWWNFSCRTLRIGCSLLLKEYMLLYEYNKSDHSHPRLDSSMLSFRSLWLQLAVLTRNSADSLSLAQGTLILYNFSRLLFTTYTMCSIFDPAILSLMGSGFLLSLTAVSFMCKASHDTQDGIRRDLQDALQITKKMNCTTEHTRQMMVDFLLLMLRQSPAISLTFNGYITVGRSLLTRVLTTLATTLVVVLQLQINQKSLSFDEFLTFTGQFYVAS